MKIESFVYRGHYSHEAAEKVPLLSKVEAALDTRIHGEDYEEVQKIAQALEDSISIGDHIIVTFTIIGVDSNE